MQIVFGNIIIFTSISQSFHIIQSFHSQPHFTWILPTQEHGISLHLFMLSLISLISILQFSVYNSFVSLGGFIPRYYFILFCCNGIFIPLYPFILLKYENFCQCPHLIRQFIQLTHSVLKSCLHSLTDSRILPSTLIYHGKPLGVNI